jgi:hypothetical protein
MVELGWYLRLTLETQIFATEICTLPTTGVDAGSIVLVMFLLVGGVIAVRGLRASGQPLSAFVALPILVIGLMTSSIDPNRATGFATTLRAPTPAQLSDCLDVLTPWLATTTDYQQLAQTYDSYGLVDIYAKAEASNTA